MLNSCLQMLHSYMETYAKEMFCVYSTCLGYWGKSFVIPPCTVLLTQKINLLR